MRLKIVILCLVGAALALAQTALTNDSIMKMVTAGLSDDVVVSAIKAQPAQYSTDPDGLIALKTAGVSDTVIKAMVDRMAASAATPAPVDATAAPAAATGAATNAAPDARGVVYVYRNRFLSGPAPNSPSVFCDGGELARIQNGRYFSIRLDPGKHSFKSTDEKSIVDVDVEAGQSYYIRGEVVPVKLKPRGKLVQMSPEQGGSEARVLKPIDSSMVKNSDLVLLDPLK
jgi:hypothetical protein